MVTVIYTEEAMQWIFLSIYCRVYWLHMTSKHMRREKREKKPRSSTLATTVALSALLGEVT